MRITRRQLRRIIFETAPTFGLRSGDTVRHKDEPERGTGKVVAKGSTRDRSISVIWSDGSRQRHDPSALVKEAKMRITRRQLRRIIKEEKQLVLTERRVRNIVRSALREGRGADTPDADAIAQIAAAIKAGGAAEELASEHPSARVFSDALLNFDDLYGPEAEAYMDSIERALTDAGADFDGAVAFVTTLANA